MARPGRSLLDLLDDPTWTPAKSNDSQSLWLHIQSGRTLLATNGDASKGRLRPMPLWAERTHVPARASSSKIRPLDRESRADRAFDRLVKAAEVVTAAVAPLETSDESCRLDLQKLERAIDACTASGPETAAFIATGTKLRLEMLDMRLKNFNKELEYRTTQLKGMSEEIAFAFEPEELARLKVLRREAVKNPELFSGTSRVKEAEKESGEERIDKGKGAEGADTIRVKRKDKRRIRNEAGQAEAAAARLDDSLAKFLKSLRAAGGRAKYIVACAFVLGEEREIPEPEQQQTFFGRGVPVDWPMAVKQDIIYQELFQGNFKGMWTDLVAQRGGIKAMALASMTFGGNTFEWAREMFADFPDKQRYDYARQAYLSLFLSWKRTAARLKRWCDEQTPELAKAVRDFVGPEWLLWSDRATLLSWEALRRDFPTVDEIFAKTNERRDAIATKSKEGQGQEWWRVLVRGNNPV
ncbi:MAG: hypothetical protein M1832_000131 [Thelocarpon impressellum]|nr:MAG: hypothetical protein M1832_000131 [Thelocarpon impressellum]